MTPAPSTASAQLRRLQRLRLAGLSALACLLMFGYALARPATDSIFLGRHGSEALPGVWLMVAACSGLVVWLYNRLVFRLGLMRLFAIFAFASGVGLSAAALAVQHDVPFSGYGLYLLKDLYMVALVEIFYSYANSMFPLQVARWAYGWFGIVGASSGIVGHLAVGRVAMTWGSEAALHLLLPLLVLTGFVGLLVERLPPAPGAPSPPADIASERTSLAQAIAVVRASSYLGSLLLLVALVQVVVTLVDFDFNQLVNSIFADQDQRTRVLGRVYAAMSTATVICHALTGPTLRGLGVPLTLLAVPLLLATSVGAYLLLPLFVLAATIKVASKTLDYTLLRAAKEMLYIPLSLREQTQGKALIDVLTYRVAKGAASLLVLGMLRLGLTRLTNQLTLGLLAAWFALTTVIVRRFRRRVGRDEELRGC